MNLSKIWASYYPVILAFLSFLYSVSLWFTGNKLEGIFVGIWVPSILGFSVAIRQIRRDTNQEKEAKNDGKFNHVYCRILHFCSLHVGISHYDLQSE